jgi:RNA exonuclease 1
MASTKSKSSTKYKLFSAPDLNGEVPVCAFYLSAEGCRNGNKCKFSHGNSKSTPKQKSTPITKSPTKRDQKQQKKIYSKSEIVEATGSVVSSESEDSDDDVNITDLKKLVRKRSAPLPTPPKQNAPKQIQTQEKQPKKKVRRSDNSSTPFPSAGKKRSIDDTNPFLPPSETSNVATQRTQSAPLPKNEKQVSHPQVVQKKEKNEKKEKNSRTETVSAKTVSTNGMSSFALNLGLPVKSFSIPGVDKDQALCKFASIAEPEPESIDPKSVLPTNTEEGRKWMDLVVKTREHPTFERRFSFTKKSSDDSEEEITSSDEDDSEDWFLAEPFGEWCKNNPHAIAIDCEMCATKDPETGRMDHKALCRLSVVNAVNPTEVLIDTLVKPKWPVVDHRTWVNGIEESHLENVEFTIDHAQAFMKALCSLETVIIGHAVHNDLEALKMKHYCVVDSAMLLKVKDDEKRTPSLKDAVKTLLGQDMPKTHDSVNDARVSLAVLEHYLEKDGEVAEIIATSRERERLADKLFIHRIPRICREEHILKMIQQYTNVIPSSCEPIVFNGNTGKTHVIFQSPKHAFLAFDSIKGSAKPDKSGRMQKRIFMRNNEYVQVRLMVKSRTPRVEGSKPETESPSTTK